MNDIHYYTQQKGKLITAISISEILKQLPTLPSFNHRYLSDYFLNGYFASEQNLFETLFEGIYRVPIGYQLKQKAEWLSVERTWFLEYPIDYPNPTSFKEAVDVFQGLLKKTMEEMLYGYENIAVELSGGLDSSSVAALVRNCRPNDHHLLALTHGVPDKMPEWFSKLSKTEQKQCQSNAYDESCWSQLVAEHLKLSQRIMKGNDHFHQILEKHTEILGNFAEVLFPLLNTQSYEICQTLGIQTLLSGFGGDELLTQQHLGLYWHEQQAQGKTLRTLFEKVKHKKLRDWLVYFKCVKPTSSLWHAPETHLPYLKIDTFAAKRTILPMHKTLHEREYDYIEGSVSLHWQRRIETSQILAKAYGIDYQFPLTHPRLMQYFYHLSSEYKYRAGRSRSFMRHCMRDFLPKSVVWRDNKAGGTAPAAWFDLLNVLPELFLSRITPDYAGILVDYVNIPKLIQRVEKAPVIDSTMVRLMVAVMMVAHLEKWLNPMMLTRH